MFIRRLQIDGFGLLTDYRLDTLPNGLIIICGNNETGKSTLLGFVRAMLFGFGKHKNEEKFQPLFTKSHKGVLTLEKADNTAVVISRTFSPRNVVDFADTKGNRLPEAGLTEILNGATKELFKNVYAFSLIELRTMETLNAEQVRDALYGASIGAKLHAIPAAQNALNKRLEALLRTRAASAITDKVDELVELRLELDAAVTRTGRYSDLQVRIKELKRQIEKEEENKAELEKEFEKITKHLKYHPEWRQLQNDMNELSLLPQSLTTLPRDILQIYDIEFTKQEAAERSLNDARLALSDGTRKLELIEVKQQLLGLEPEISELYRQNEQHRQISKKLALTSHDLSTKQDEINDFLRELGEGWDLARATSLANTGITGQDLFEFEQRLTAARQNRENAEKAMSERRQRAEQAQQMANQKQELADKLKTVPVNIDESQLSSLLAGVNKFKNDCTTVDRLESEEKRLKNILQSRQEDLSTLLGGHLDHLNPFLSGRQSLDRSECWQTPDFRRYDQRRLLEHKDAVGKATRTESTRRDLQQKLETDHKESIKAELQILEQIKALGCDQPLVEDSIVNSVRMESIRLKQLYKEDRENQSIESEKERNCLQIKSSLGLSLGSNQVDIHNFVPAVDFANSYLESSKSLSDELIEKRALAQTAGTRVDEWKVRVSDLMSKLQAYSESQNSIEELNEKVALMKQLREQSINYKKTSTSIKALETRLEDKLKVKEQLQESVAANAKKQVTVALILIGLVGIGASVALIMLGQTSLAIWPIIVAAAMIGLLMMVGKNSQATGDQSKLAAEIESLKQELNKLQEQQTTEHRALMDLASQLGFSAPPEENELDSLQNELAEQIISARQKNDLLAQLATERSQLAERETETALLNEELQIIENKALSLTRDWNSMLSTIGCNVVEPAEFLKAFEKLRQAIESFNQVKERSTKTHEEICNALGKLKEHGIVQTLDPAAASVAIENVEIWLAQQESLTKIKGDITGKQGELRKATEFKEQTARQLCQSQEDLKKAEQELGTVLSAASVWLADLGLPPSIPLSKAMSVFDTIEDIGRNLDELFGLQKQLRELVQSITSFREQSAKLCTLTANAITAKPAELGNAIQECSRHLDENKELCTKSDIAQTELNNAKDTLIQAEEQLTQANKDLQNQINCESELHNCWRTELLRLNLETSLEPRSARVVVDIANKIVGETKLVRERERECQTQKNKLTEFENRAALMFNTILHERSEGKSVFDSVDKLHAKLLAEQLKKKELEETQRAVKQADAIYKQRINELESAKRKVAETLEMAGCKDQFELKALDRQRNRLVELDQKVNQSSRTLTKLIQVSDFAEVQRIYKDFDHAEVEQTQSRIKQQLEDISARLSGLGGTDDEQTGLNFQLTALINDRDRIESSDELRDIRAREAILITQLNQLRRDWYKLILAKKLLERAKQRFEIEGQPHVLDLASDGFRIITDGAYKRVVVTKDERQQQTLEVITASGHRVPCQVLSTGTQEQLYLALRFAFISHRATTCEQLPVLMDDILVNFDPDRASKTAELIIELSKSHQVFFFTCHPQAVDIFRRLGPINLVQLKATQSKVATLALANIFNKRQPNPEEVAPTFTPDSFEETTHQDEQDGFSIEDFTDTEIQESEQPTNTCNPDYQEPQSFITAIKAGANSKDQIVNDLAVINFTHAEADSEDEQEDDEPSDRNFIDDDQLELAQITYGRVLITLAKKREAFMAKSLCNDLISLFRRSDVAQPDFTRKIQEIRRIFDKEDFASARLEVERLCRISSSETEVDLWDLAAFGKELFESHDFSSALIVWSSLGRLIEENLVSDANLIATYHHNFAITRSQLTRDFRDVIDYFKTGINYCKTNRLQQLELLICEGLAECAWAKGVFGTCLEYKKRTFDLLNEVDNKDHAHQINVLRDIVTLCDLVGSTELDRYATQLRSMTEDEISSYDLHL